MLSLSAFYGIPLKTVLLTKNSFGYVASLRWVVDLKS